MSLMGGPVPNALGAGGLNRDFFPHGLVTFSRGALFELEACVALGGQIHTAVTMVGSVTTVAELNGHIQTAVTLAGEIRDALQLTGEITTIVSLAGEIGDCD